MRVDWMLLQSTENEPHGWVPGDTLYFRNHRVSARNGFFGPVDERFGDMLQAPEEGYRASGSCGNYRRMIKGQKYYTKILCAGPETKGFGKVQVVELTYEPPPGIEVLDSPL